MIPADVQLTETMARYLDALDAGTPLMLDQIAPDPVLRAQIEAALAEGLPVPVYAPSPAERSAANTVALQLQTQLRQRLASQTLTALRTARQFSLGALARAVDLPVDLLARIERGGVLAATIPAKLVAALAHALAAAEAEVQAALAIPPRAAVARLSAHDGTTAQKEQAVAFVDALHASSATRSQRTHWV